MSLYYSDTHHMYESLLLGRLAAPTAFRVINKEKENEPNRVHGTKQAALHSSSTCERNPFSQLYRSVNSRDQSTLREIGISLPVHRTLHIEKVVLPYTLCYLLCPVSAASTLMFSQLSCFCSEASLSIYPEAGLSYAPLSSEHGICQSVKARHWSCLSGKHF